MPHDLGRRPPTFGLRFTGHVQTITKAMSQAAPFVPGAEQNEQLLSLDLT